MLAICYVKVAFSIALFNLTNNYVDGLINIDHLFTYD